MIIDIRQRTGAGQRYLVAMHPFRAGDGSMQCPSDRLWLSIRIKPGYDGGTFGFDPGENP